MPKIHQTLPFCVPFSKKIEGIWWNCSESRNLMPICSADNAVLFATGATAGRKESPSGELDDPSGL